MRLKERIEWHYTPKHGSWLNMAEIEIGVAQHQCLDRRIGDQATLERELEAWSQKRNAAHCGTDWQFTMGWTPFFGQGCVKLGYGDHG